MTDVTEELNPQDMNFLFHSLVVLSLRTFWMTSFVLGNNRTMQQHQKWGCVSRTQFEFNNDSLPHPTSTCTITITHNFWASKVRGTSHLSSDLFVTKKPSQRPFQISFVQAFKKYKYKSLDALWAKLKDCRSSNGGRGSRGHWWRKIKMIHERQDEDEDQDDAEGNRKSRINGLLRFFKKIIKKHFPSRNHKLASPFFDLFQYWTLLQKKIMPGREMNGLYYKEK